MTDKELSALKALAEAAQANDFANGTSLTSEFLAFTDEASPAAILSLISRVEQAEAARADMETRKDSAYFERNQVVAGLAKCFPSGVARTAIEGWSEDWHGCVYINLPTGQVSWHFHDSQAHLFDGLPQYNGKWDGHDTPEKYRRVAALTLTATGTGEAMQIDQALEPAPGNNLPNWSECALRVENSSFIAKRVAEGGYGPEPDSKLATELHRFIYEYDYADPYRSAWFLHRLELVIEEAKRAVATSTKPADGEIPAVLFDGKSVYDEITAHFGKSHCYSADAVSTVLDAVVRLMRKSGAGGVAGAGDTLPPLPKIGDLGATREARVLHLHYSAEQMREYGQACAQLGRQQTPVGDSVDTPEFHELLGKFRAADIRTTEGVANEIIIFIHSWKDAQLARERHARNEWADAACNGLQWLRNIEDGTTTDLKRARENMEASVAHARQVSDQLGTAPAAQAQGEPVAYVPIHPRLGPLWPNTVPTLECDRPAHYPTKPLYFGPTPQADDAIDAKRHRYTRATTTAVCDPETGERIEVTPEMYDAAIDSAMASDPNWDQGIKAQHLKSVQADEVRDAALEEAAKICETQNDTDWPTPLGCAKSIRALKVKQC